MQHTLHLVVVIFVVYQWQFSIFSFDYNHFTTATANFSDATNQPGLIASNVGSGASSGSQAAVAASQSVGSSGSQAAGTLDFATLDCNTFVWTIISRQ